MVFKLVMAAAKLGEDCKVKPVAKKSSRVKFQDGNRSRARTNPPLDSRRHPKSPIVFVEATDRKDAGIFLALELRTKKPCISMAKFACRILDFPHVTA